MSLQELYSGFDLSRGFPFQIEEYYNCSNFNFTHSKNNLLWMRAHITLLVSTKIFNRKLKNKIWRHGLEHGGLCSSAILAGQKTFSAFSASTVLTVFWQQVIIYGIVEINKYLNTLVLINLHINLNDLNSATRYSVMYNNYVFRWPFVWNILYSWNTA